MNYLKLNKVLLKVALLQHLCRLGFYVKIMCNANLMQLDNFIDVFLARHVSGTYAHHQGALDVELQHMVFCTEFVDGWWS